MDSTTGNMLPAGGGGGTLLPAIRNSSNYIAQMRKDLEKIDSLLGSINTKANALRLDRQVSVYSGGSTSAHSNGMPGATFTQTSYPSNTPSSSPAGGGPLALPGGAGGGSGGGANKFGRIAASFAGSALYGGLSASLAAAKSGVDSFYNSDTLWYQMQAAGGWGSQKAVFQSAANNFSGGATSPSDFYNAMGTYYSAGFAPSTFNSPAFGRSQAAMSLATGMSGTQMAQMTAGVYNNPKGIYMAMVHGANIYNKQTGQLKPMDQMIGSIFSASGGYRDQTQQQLDADLTPYGKLSRNLQSTLGLSEQQVTAFRPVFEAAIASGAPIDSSNQSFMKALNAKGMSNQAFKSLLQKGSGQTQYDVNAYTTKKAGIDAANKSIANIDKNVGIIAKIFGAPSGFMGSMGGTVLGNVANDGIAALMFKLLSGGGKSVLGSAAGGLGEVASKVVPGAAVGALGVTATHAAANKFTKPGSTAHRTVSVVGDMASGAIGGAMIGSMIAPGIGTAVGGALGAVGGAALGYFGGNSSTDKKANDSHYSQWAPNVADAVKVICSHFNISATTYSGHEPDEQHAADFWPRPLDQGTQIAEWVKQNANALCVQYVIWRQHIWNIDRNAEGWRLMEDRGSRTQNHFDHVHVSFKYGGKVGKTSDGAAVVSGSLAGVGDSGGQSANSANPGVPGAQLSAVASAMSMTAIPGMDTGFSNMFSVNAGGDGATGGSSGGSAPGGSSAGSGTPTKTSTSAKGVLGVLANVAGRFGLDPRLAYADAWVESGLNPKAVGDHGTSFGLFQLHEGGELGSHNAAWAYNPTNNASTALAEMARVARAHPNWSPGQIAAAAQRPADPSGYAAKVNSIYQQAPWNKYDQGSFDVKGDQTARIHDGEMVLPKDFAASVRAAIGTHSGATSGSHGPVNVTITAKSPLTDAEITRIATKVKSVIEDGNHMNTIGSI